MSTTIDENVVAMRFDNRNFEKNVATSMSTLDKFKQKFNFKGLGDGLDEIDKKASKISFDPIGKSIDAVQTKFSYFQATIQHQLNRIVDSAIDAGKRITSAFTIDPVKTGFNEYELKMGSVQTIMASTGESLDVVNKYLEELNAYSDKTIYSFSDMTSSIGKFTNAGVKLEDAVAAIKGISNEAAVSGANAQEASRAMYNFAQALSAGYVKLIDWKSIETANMATVEFKQHLLDTALALGTVKKQGDQYVTTTKNMQGKTSTAFDAVKNFNDSLNHQWMTTDVLTKTLAMYADETTDIGKKAYAAAQDVKTFSMMMDTLKEAAQSGWAQTWELLVGDFEQAKTIFTEASIFFGNIIDKASKARNNLLRGALYNVVGEDDLKKLDEAGKATENFKNFMIAMAKEHNIAIDEMIKSEGSFEATLKNGWLSDDIYEEAMRRMTRAERDLIKEMTSGIASTEEKTKRVSELTKAVRDNDKAYFSLLEKMNRPSGRELLIDSVRNSLKAIGTAINGVKKAWTNIFPKTTSDDLYNIIKRLHDFSERLIRIDSDGSKITRTFRGIFSVVKLVSNLFNGAFKIGLKVIQSILGHFNLDILDVTASIGDALYNFNQWIEKNDFIAKSVDKVINVIEKCVKTIKSWMIEFEKLPAVQTGIETLKKGFYSIGERLSSTKQRFSEFIERVKALDHITLDNLDDILKDFYDNVICYMFDFGSIFDKAKTSFTEFKENVTQGLTGTNGKFADFKNKIIEYATALKEKLGDIDIFGSLLTIGSGVLIIKTAKRIMSIFETLGSVVEAFTGPAKGITNVLNQIAGSLKAYSFNLKSKAILNIAYAIAVLAGSLTVLSMCDSKKLIVASLALAVVSAGLIALCVVLGKFKAIDIGKVSTSMIAISGSLLILVVALKKLEGIKTEGLGKRLASLALLASGLLLFSGLSSMIPGMNKSAVSLLAFAVALRVLLNGLQKMNDLNLDNTGKIIKILTGIILSMSVLARSSKGLSAKSAIGMIGMAITLRLFINSFKKVVDMDLNKIQRGIPALIAIFGSFSTLLLASKLAGKNAAKAGVMMLAFSVSLVIISKAIKKLGKLSSYEIEKGMKVIAGMGLIFGAIVVLSKFAGQNAAKAGAMLLGMSGTFIAVSLCMAILGRMKDDQINRAMKAVTTISACFALLIASTGLSKFDKKAKGGILALTVAIGAIAIALGALSFINPEKLKSSTAALSAVMAMFALMTASTKFMGEKISSKILTMIGAIVAIGAVLKVLGTIPSENSIASAKSLSIVLTSLTASMLILSNAKKVKNSNIKSLYEMSGVVAILAVIMGAMSALDVETSIKNASVLSAMILVLSGTMLILNKIENVDTKTMTSLYMLSGVVAILATILGVMSALNVEASIQNATSLSVVLTALTGALFILSKSQTISGKSILALYTISGAVAIIATIMGVLDSMDIAISLESALALSTLLLSMAGVCAIMAAIGPVASQALLGAAAFDGVIAVIGAFVLGIGALFSQEFMSKGVDYIEKGFEVLNAIAYGLGSFVGNIIGGFTDGVMSGLPAIGQYLTDFANNASGFINMLSTLNPEVATSASGLAKALLAICAAELLDTITGWLTGTSDMSMFGSKLREFAEGIVTFSQIVDGKINETSVKTATNAGKMITELANTIPNSGGILGTVFGENDVDVFGSKLQTFAQGIVTFSETVNGKINKDGVETAKNAGLMITELANAVPNSGGIIANLFGDNDIEKFGGKLKKFAEGIVTFSETVNGKINKDGVETAKNAGLMITELANAVPNSGGIIADLFGDNDVDVFGSKLQTFAQGIVTFSETVNGKINKDGVETAKNAGIMITELANSVPTSGGKLKEFFSGSKDIEEFGEKLKGFGDGLATFCNGEISKVSYTDLTITIGKLQEIVDLMGTINDGSIGSIKEFNTALSETAKISIGGFITEFADSNTVLVLAIKKFFELAKYTIEEFQPSFYTAGDNATTGFLNGLQNRINTGEVSAAGYRIGAQALKGIKESLDIHSPSKEMKKVGKFAIDGFVEGLTTSGVKINTIAKAVFEKFSLTALNSVKNINTAKGVISSYANTFVTSTKKVEKQQKIATKALQLYTSKIYKSSSYYKQDQQQLKGHIKQLKEYYKKRTELNQQLSDANDKLAKAKTKHEKQSALNQKKNIQNSIKENNKNIQSMKTQIDKDRDQMVKNAKKALYEVKKAIKDAVKDYLSIFNVAAKKINLFGAINEPEKVTTLKDVIKSALTDKTGLSNFSLDTGINMLEKFSSSAENLAEAVQSANDELTEAKEDLTNAEKELLEAQTKSLSVNGRSKKYLDEIKTAEEKVATAKEKVAEAEAKVQGLASNPTKDMLSNMKSNVDAYNAWQKDLKALAKTKISDGLLDYLTGLGISGAEQVHTFVQMTKEEIAEANKYWKSYNSMSTKTLIGGIKDKSAAMTEWGKNIKKFAKLNIDEEVKATLLKEFQEQGIDSANYLEQILSMSSKELKDFVKNYKEMISVPEQVSKEVAKSVESVTKKTEESKNAMNDYIATMKANLQAEKDYEKNLTKIKKLGIDDRLYAQLVENGDKEMIAAFAKATKTEIEEANKIFREAASMTADSWLDSYGERLGDARAWNANMKKLATLNISEKLREQLYAEFANRGIEGNDDLATILGFDDKQLERFAKYYEKSGKYASIIGNNVIAGSIAVSTEVQENMNKSMKDSANQAMTAYDDELKEGKKKVKKTAKSVGTTTVKTIAKEVSPEKVEPLGKNVCTGIAKGINDNKHIVDNAVSALAKDNVLGKFANIAMIKSPSRVMMKFGRFCDEGLAIGLQDYAYIAEDATEGLSEDVINTMHNAIVNIANWANSDMDTTPTIRPILDMDELRNQVGAIGGMFDSQSIGMNIDTASRIATRMYNHSGSQNGSVVHNDNSNTFSPTYDNKFYIYGTNTKEIADEVDRRLQHRTVRRSTQWG